VLLYCTKVKDSDAMLMAKPQSVERGRHDAGAGGPPS
jgi:hypothetical protein